MDRANIVAEVRDAAADFRVLLDGATSRELRSGTDGTKWTNEQLLFHMLFGYLVVRRLLILVRILGRLPEGVSRGFAATLNAGTRPFHVINYVGSLGGARVLGHARMERLFDHIVKQPRGQPARGERRRSGARHALSRRLGPVLPRLHDPRRRLRLRHAALPAPPTPTHPRWGARGRRRSLKVMARGAQPRGSPQDPSAELVS
jgi:hypothetical protein